MSGNCIRDAEGLAALRDRSRRLLAVFAHPDDEAYGCAGAFARHGADPDAATVLLTLTRGEASSMGPERGLSPGEVGDLREARLVDVAAVVGLDGLLVDGFPDGRLAREPLPRIAARIGGVLAAFAPQVVITGCPRGVNGHADHVATHWAVRRACEETTEPRPRLAMVAYPPEACEAIAPRLLFATKSAEMDVRLDLVPAEVDAKEHCLRIHDAIATLREDGDPSLQRRPAVEHYDLWGEDLDPPADDLFAGLA